MAEKKIVIEEETLEYHGLFNLKELYAMIDQWIREHGYDRYEKKANEQVTEDGRHFYIELEPFKKLSEYARAEQKVEITMEGVEDVEVDHDGITETLQKGNAHFKFQARLITDYEHKWEGTPLYQFIRTVIDKFVRKTQTEDFEDECAQDAHDLREEIKAHLNLFRYKV